MSRAPATALLALAATLPPAGAAMPEAGSQAAQAGQEADALRARARAEQARADALRGDAVRLAARVQAAERLAARQVAEARAAARRARAADARLAAMQRPLAALAGGLGAGARVPPLALLVSPGTLAEQVHLRAALDTVLPAVRDRSRAAHEQAAVAATLRAAASAAAAQAVAATAALRREQAALLDRQRQAGVRVVRTGTAARDAADRALSADEGARLAAERAAAGRRDAAVVAALAAVPRPRPRPGPDVGPRPGSDAYRVPVVGAVIRGFGERTDAGPTEALALAATPGALVVAPAAGRIRFAGPFRDYGGVVVIDHGGGWSSVLTGFGAVTTAVGGQVAQGSPIGAAGARPMTVELRRDGRPLPVAHMIARHRRG